MTKTKMTTARGQLLKLDTGVNRRLLYLAAGGDVGCSVGLFWNICDSFYLVDPEYGSGIKYEDVLKDLSEGRGYMAGMQVFAVREEQGYWEGAVPGRRYRVYLKGADPKKEKERRLCFASSGSNAWLAATATDYNVVINKDYAGIDGSSDQNYPYEKVWARLNYKGIFCETIGTARSSEECDFAKYRFLGFEPLFEVTSNSGATIGFGGGFHLFRKITDGNEGYFRNRQQELDTILGVFRQKLDVFVSMADFGPTAIDEDESDRDLVTLKGLMLNAPKKNWADFIQTEAFDSWLTGLLPKKYAQIPDELICDLLGPLRLNTWGSW